MSLTDAKLFYQLSQIESQKPIAHESHAANSPDCDKPDDVTSTSGSLELEESPRREREIITPAGQSPTLAKARDRTQPQAMIQGNGEEGAVAFHGGQGNLNPDDGPQLPPAIRPGPAAWTASQTAENVPNSLGGGIFTDTDPHITAELSAISAKIQKVRGIRQKYMQLSLQRPGDNPKDSPDWEIYPPPPEPAWVPDKERGDGSIPSSLSNSMVLTTDSSPAKPSKPSKPSKRRKPGQDIGEDFDMEHLLPLPPPSDLTFVLDDNGVYQVLEQAEPCVQVPTMREFYMDLDEILSVSSDGPTKSFSFRRLQYLEGQFNMYVLLNEYQETADSKRVPHRDFYNVRKVDTHVHHSACMNQKHLLRFIKSKMKKCPDEVVLYRDDRHLTLAEVFQSINLTAYDLSIDTLDMHVCTIYRLHPCLFACTRDSAVDLRFPHRPIQTRSTDSTNST